MVSPKNKQEKDIISFMYVLFIGTIMPIENNIKPINNNIIFSIYINFVIYYYICKDIKKYCDNKIISIIFNIFIIISENIFIIDNILININNEIFKKIQ